MIRLISLWGLKIPILSLETEGEQLIDLVKGYIKDNPDQIGKKVEEKNVS